MGRPPCFEKIGVRKGSWTPDEDIILVSYIQKHGPGNWRDVPSNTGLRRCSKSCRLRWTNYLRQGIKRGNFTQHEEMMIIHLQALLGNRWAAIASYLPQRTDNDVKNYWNTHLKKKLSKSQGQNGILSDISQSISKGQWERRLQTDIERAKQALCEALFLDKSSSENQHQQLTTPIQATSAKNIAPLPENWSKNYQPGLISTQTSFNDPCSVGVTSSPGEGQISNMTFIDSFNSSEVLQEDQAAYVRPETGIFHDDHASKPRTEMSQMHFRLLEKWLFDDGVAQGQDGNFTDMALRETSGWYCFEKKEMKSHFHF